MGFEKDKYSGKSKYTGELCHSFIDKPIYMFIKNISEDTPFAIIQSNTKFDQKLKTFKSEIPNLSCIIIQFKTKANTGYNLVNFAGTPHRIVFSFKTSS